MMKLAEGKIRHSIFLINHDFGVVIGKSVTSVRMYAGEIVESGTRTSFQAS
jgi:ABC-type dipeptide/oligopeptide/nickel transport system ATPase component